MDLVQANAAAFACIPFADGHERDTDGLASPLGESTC